MESQKMSEYETVHAIVAGGKQAVRKAVNCCKGEIDGLSTVAVGQPDGSTKQGINENIRQFTTRKLIEALPQFPLEEIEKGNARQARKKTGCGSQYMTSTFCLLMSAVFVNVTQQNAILGGKGIKYHLSDFHVRKTL